MKQVLITHGIKACPNSGEDLKYVFGFGNTQKLINMTAKYIFIGCYSKEKLCRSFKICHCPMDGIMLNVVWEEYKNLHNKNEDLLVMLNG